MRWCNVFAHNIIIATTSSSIFASIHWGWEKNIWSEEKIVATRFCKAANFLLAHKIAHFLRHSIEFPPKKNFSKLLKSYPGSASRLIWPCVCLLLGERENFYIGILQGKEKEIKVKLLFGEFDKEKKGYLNLLEFT